MATGSRRFENLNAPKSAEASLRVTAPVHSITARTPNLRPTPQTTTPAGEGGRLAVYWIVGPALGGDLAFHRIAQHIATAPDGFDVVLAFRCRRQFLA